jgi:hypothetical protein
VSREEAYEQAAVWYRRAGYDLDAARCYRRAGAYRRAAEIYETAGEYTQAADSFGDAGLPELGAWLLAHLAGQPAAARELLGPPPAAGLADAAVAAEAGADVPPHSPGLRRRLVLARCEIAEGAAPDGIRPVITAVCAALADQQVRSDQITEEWAVALSEAAARYDQAALVFAAAVRGGRYGAEHRWRAWSRDVLHADIILPPAAAGPVRPATAAAPTTAS